MLKIIDKPTRTIVNQFSVFPSHTFLCKGCAFDVGICYYNQNVVIFCDTSLGDFYTSHNRCPENIL